jgi:hypothetical protein
MVAETVDAVEDAGTRLRNGRDLSSVVKSASDSVRIITVMMNVMVAVAKAAGV